MGLEWVFMVRGDNGSHRIIGFIGCIVSYCRLDRIVSSGSYQLKGVVSDGLDLIVSAGSGNTGFYVLAGYCLDGTDGLNGVLVVQGWGGRRLAPAGTGVPPWAPEQERHRWLLRGGGLWEVVADTNCVGDARTRIISVREAK